MNYTDTAREIMWTMINFKVPFTLQDLKQELKQKYDYEFTSERINTIIGLLDDLRDSGDIRYFPIDDDVWRYCTKAVINYHNVRLLSPLDKPIQIYYQSDFTLFELICLFSRVLKLKEIENFDLYDLKNFIEKCREDKKFNDLLHDYNSNENEESRSLEFEKAIKGCETAKLLTSDCYQIKIIQEEKDYYYSTVNVINKKSKYLELVFKFANEYQKFIAENKKPLELKK